MEINATIEKAAASSDKGYIDSAADDALRAAKAYTDSSLGNYYTKTETDSAAALRAGEALESAMSYADGRFVTRHYVDSAVSGISSPEFTEAAARVNIESGESIPTVFGKVKRYFSDLDPVAFSGSYNDLTDKPAAGYILEITFARDFLGLEFFVEAEGLDRGWASEVGLRLKEQVEVPAGNTVYTVKVTKNGVTYSTEISVGACFGIYPAELRRDPLVFGVSWDGTSASQWTRTDAAADFTDPVPYTAGMNEGEYGSPFDNIMPWSGMTVEEHEDCGKVVKIPKFYYKLGYNSEGASDTSNGGMYIKISSEPQAGFEVSPAHIDRGDGKGERDFVYIGRYHCANSDYKSRSGELPKTRVTRSTARTAIHNLGSQIWQTDFAMRFTLWLLYLVEFADWNSQAVIGFGIEQNSDPVQMGYTDSMPYHTGTTQSNRNTHALGTQYRNIEGLWENCTDWCDGVYCNDGFRLINDPADFSDTSGGVNTGSFGVTGWPSTFEIHSEAGYTMFHPIRRNGVTGSESTYTCDQWNYNDAIPCVISGGYYSDVGYYGLFYLSHAGLTVSDKAYGTRLMKLPD